MDRTEQINQVINDYRMERFTESKEKIRAYYQENNEEIYKDFVKVISDGLQRCEDKEKRIKNIILSILYSSNLTKSYQLQIAFCDERMLLDDAPIHEYWGPAFIFSRVEEDMESFKKRAAAKIPRIKEYELDEIRNTYIWNHYFMVMLLLRELVPAAMEEVYGKYDILDDEVMVSLGRYMEKSIPIYQRGQTDEIFSSGNR